MLQLYNQISKPHQHEHTRLDSQCILQQFRSVRSSDPLGANFLTTQGLFFFLRLVPIQIHHQDCISSCSERWSVFNTEEATSWRTSLPKSTDKNRGCRHLFRSKAQEAKKMAGEAGGHLQILCFQWGLQPAFASAEADWEPIPLPPPFTSRWHCTVVHCHWWRHISKFPKNSKIPQSRTPAKFGCAEFRTYATPIFFFQLTSKGLDAF